jgi:hypothetical protein
MRPPMAAVSLAVLTHGKGFVTVPGWPLLVVPHADDKVAPEPECPDFRS